MLSSDLSMTLALAGVAALRLTVAAEIMANKARQAITELSEKLIPKNETTWEKSAQPSSQYSHCPLRLTLARCLATERRPKAQETNNIKETRDARPPCSASATN